MGKRRICKNKEKQLETPKKEKEGERKYLGGGYFLQYAVKANPDADNKLCFDQDGKITEIKKITDGQGYFVDFPGVVEGEWRKRLRGGVNGQIRYYYSVGEFRQGFALVSWTVQPDGRYEEDETGFGGENYEEVTLYSYMNPKGDFVTPFAEFDPRKYMESLEAFKERTIGFMENSMPAGHELWVQESVKEKVDGEGAYKPFFGNTVVFPLEEDMLNYMEEIQKKVSVIREDPEICNQGQYVAKALEKETYHITLHDLTYDLDKEKADEKIRATQKGALYIIKKLKEMDFPVIKMEPAYLFAMNSTALVLGFRAMDEEHQKNLMMLYELFQTVVDLPRPLTPHGTITYFKYAKRHDSWKIRGVRDIISEVNQQIKRDREAGVNPLVELDVKKLAYQHFLSMNHYDTIG